MVIDPLTHMLCVDNTCFQRGRGMAYGAEFSTEDSPYMHTEHLCADAPEYWKVLARQG